MVLAYDLLEGDHFIVFPSVFKMAESFDNLDTILRDWAKDKVRKILAEALNRYEQQREESKDKALYFLENDSENTRAVSVSSRARLNQTQNWSW